MASRCLYNSSFKNFVLLNFNADAAALYQNVVGNNYPVVLTRARQGIIICVPYGNDKKTPEGFPEDPTRLSKFYDGIYNYFKNLGMQEIE